PSDLATSPRDMATSPADMTMPPGDMPPPADMSSPPGDMPPPADMSSPPGDMPPPADMAPPDLTMPGDDMLPPTDDLPLPTDMTIPTGDMITLPPDLSGADLTPASDPTEFFVVRVGAGAAPLTAAATAVFLERRKVTDGMPVGTARALPTAVSGTNRRLTLGGTSAAEGELTRSVDGKYLLLGGYDAAVGTASVGSSMSATVNRVIGRLDAAGALDTSTAGDFFSLNNLRGAASTDGSALWAVGSSGIVYTTFGSTAAPTVLLGVNMRAVRIAAGQLLGSSGATTNHGINQIGTGTPTTTATATLLGGFAAEPMTSFYGFLALDRDGTAGVDVIYAADDRAVASGGGIQRWTLSGATFVLDGTIKKGLTAGARGLTGFVSAGKVTLLATTAESPPRVVRFTDDGTALDMLPAQPLATAAANTAYRGIALAPQ
ncbi:MAG TPA: hypothetical protein PLW65_03165, partial [Pseudomonadota bacterium]|nr:hypothetical protein [Pseudomonadota bacterium]